MEEGQTIQWPKEKVKQIHVQMYVQNITPQTKDGATRIPLNTEGKSCALEGQVHYAC